MLNNTISFSMLLSSFSHWTNFFEKAGWLFWIDSFRSGRLLENFKLLFFSRKYLQLLHSIGATRCVISSLLVNPRLPEPRNGWIILLCSFFVNSFILQYCAEIGKETYSEQYQKCLAGSFEIDTLPFMVIDTRLNFISVSRLKYFC